MAYAPDMTRAAAQRDLADRFRAAGLESAALDARVLVCAALGIDHAALIRDPAAPVGAAAARLSRYAVRRLRHEPVARILGRKEFWGLPLTIGPAVLDPRPETELVVEVVLERLAGRRADPLRILDLGTGSGAILAALLQDLPAAFGVGVDRSLAACRIARQNCRTLGFATRAAIVCGCWSESLAGRFDVVVSNPPYVAAADLAGLAPEVRCHDPVLALDGGADGLDPYRAIIPCLPGVLAADGIAVFEGGSTQGDAIATLMGTADLAEIVVRHDLAGHARVVAGRARSDAKRGNAASEGPRKKISR